jgi:DNA-binding transcriptional ArsR family regulator
MPNDALSTTLAALAHPTRRAILARLARGAATVKEISGPFDMSAPAISRHLRVLEKAGLIRRGRDAQWRPCTLDAAPLRAVAAWAQEYRDLWSANGNGHGSGLADGCSNGRPGGPDGGPVLDVYLAHLRRKREAR